MVVAFGGAQEGDRDLTTQNGVSQSSERTRTGSPSWRPRNGSSQTRNERQADLRDGRSDRLSSRFANGATPDYPLTAEAGRRDIVTDGTNFDLNLDRFARTERTTILTQGQNDGLSSNRYPERFLSTGFPNRVPPRELTPNASSSNGFTSQRIPNSPLSLPPSASNGFQSNRIPPDLKPRFPSNGYLSNGLSSHGFTNKGNAFLNEGARSDAAIDKFTKYKHTEVNLRTAKDYLVPDISIDDERSTISVTELLCLRPEEILCAQDKDGDNEVMLAIMKRKVIYVLMMIDLLVKCQSTKLLNLKNNDGLTALHLAVKVDEVDITAKLMEAGVDYEIRDSKGNTPLHLACSLGRIKHVVVLTGKQMAVSSSTATNTSANISQRSIRTSATNTSTNISQRPITSRTVTSSNVTRNRTQKYDPTPYRKCANLLNYQGWNCLHLAMRNAHFQVAEYLVNVLGVDVNTRGGNRGMTVVHIAVESRDMPLLLLVLRCLKADVNLQTYDGWSSLEFAALRNDVLTARVLLTHGGLVGDYLYCREKATGGEEGAEGNPAESDDSEEDE